MVRAAATVSRSRSSPSRTTSGSCRSDGADRARERDGVGGDLALVHERFLVLVHELDRVLDRDDVGAALGVDLVDHRGQRGRLAGAGRAGHEDEALRLLGELLDDRGKLEVVERADLVGNHADRGARRAPLPVDVAADARAAPPPRRTGRVPGELGVISRRSRGSGNGLHWPPRSRLPRAATRPGGDRDHDQSARGHHDRRPLPVRGGAVVHPAPGLARRRGDQDRAARPARPTASGSATGPAWTAGGSSSSTPTRRA